MTNQIFKSALLWNSLNVLLYKFILQAHQACLFYVISKELFGISGTLFSTVYLLISLTNFGFDYSLFAFHRFYIQSQEQFQTLIKQLTIRLITLLSVTTCLLLVIQDFAYLPQISFVYDYLPSGLLTILAAIFIAESLKKTLELFAHLSFLNKTITVVDISTLACYVSILWCSYFFRGFIDLYAIFIPMCITSWLELFLISARILFFYRSLPRTHTSSPLSSQSIVRNQAINYLNQITKAFFSPNFIIIFLAYHLGMVKAGYIKLIIDIIILLYMLLNRAVGIPSAALMSQASSMQQSLLPNFKQTFLKITNGYIQFLYALACTLIFTIGPSIIHAGSANSIVSINILLFAFAGFLEYMVITYEKLFLTQNAAGRLALINTVSLITLLPVLMWASSLPQAYLLLPFVIVRLCSIAIIARQAERIWQVSPCFTLHTKTIIASSIAAVSLSIWHLFSFSVHINH